MTKTSGVSWQTLFKRALLSQIQNFCPTAACPLHALIAAIKRPNG
jgi:hypothetical protein